MPIEKARELINTGSSIDTVLRVLNISHEEYRKAYPDTPVTAGLALDVQEYKELEQCTNNHLKRVFTLSTSQLNYILYNPDAIKEQEFTVAKTRVEHLLKTTNKTQTAIADEAGVSQSYVHRIAKDLGLLRRRKKRVEISAEEWDYVFDKLNNSNATVTQLAAQLGVSRDTIYKRIRGS